MEIQALACTDIGRAKPTNEDAFLVDAQNRLYIVADGMGGHAAGEVASAMAIEEVKRFVERHRAKIDQFVQTGEGRERVQEIMEHAVRHAGQLIHQVGQSNRDKRGMGTTTSALLLTPRRGFIAHVGDSRVYLVRGDEVVQLTEDHSLINELIKRGKLRPEDAANAPYRNAVTRAVGVHADVQVDTMTFELAAGDRFLICSDGLIEYLATDNEIADVIRKHTFNDAPRAFIELANARGGKDNITALIVNFQGAGPTPSQEDIATKLAALRKMPLFQHLEYVELMAVLNVCRLASFAAGEQIFNEGDPGTEMYVVMGGLVRILKGDVELAQVGKGGHFGEMAIMDKSPRSAAAQAQAPTTLIVVGRRPLFRLMRENKDIAVKLLWCFVQVLNQRLRITNDDLKQALAPLELDSMFNDED